MHFHLAMQTLTVCVESQTEMSQIIIPYLDNGYKAFKVVFLNFQVHSTHRLVRDYLRVLCYQFLKLAYQMTPKQLFRLLPINQGK